MPHKTIHRHALLKSERFPSRFVKSTHQSAAIAMLLGMALIGAQQAKASADAPFGEELVSMVVQQCQEGNAEQAMAISQAIREQLSPPPEILALLVQINQTGCRAKPQLTSNGQITEVSLGMGFDDNINQGVSAESITLGSPIKPITLLLNNAYKPVSKSYLSATATRQIIIDNGWTLRGSLGLRQISNFSQLDTAGIQMTGRYALQALGLPSFVQVGISQSWLAGTVYRRVPSVEFQSNLGNEQQPWVLNGQIQQLSHDIVTTQDARITSISATRYLRLEPLTLIALGAGLMLDQALGQRAGGNRQGETLQISAQHSLPHGQLQAQWIHTRWATAKDFSFGLVDYPRQNQTSQLLLSYQKKPTAGTSIYVEYHRKIARDNIPIYAHTSSGIVAGWIQQWK
jgi:hypothetical protein